MRVISLFSGVGGLDLGFYAAGFDIVWANEINNKAVETYKKNFSNRIVHKDIKLVDIRDIPEADVVIGGFPCQDFSILGGGKRKGILVKRGQLYKQFTRIVASKMPKIFLAENVKGILSANKGNAIALIYNDLKNPTMVAVDLEETTYSMDSFQKQFFDYKNQNMHLFEEEDTTNDEYKILIKPVKFANFGVPQRRERVLIIGIRSDIYKGFHFPEPIYNEKNWITAGEALTGEAIFFKNVSECKFNNKIQNMRSRTKQMLASIPEGGNFKNADPSLKIKAVMSNIYRRLDRNKPSPTIIANGGGGTWGYHYSEPRALTNRERARLQTFPDDFVFEGSIAQVRTQIGNAVPPLGILPFALEIRKQIFGISDALYKEYYEFIRNLRDKQYKNFWTIKNINLLHQKFSTSTNYETLLANKSI